MNFKKTAIALAVAGVAATPLIVSADNNFYGSARIGLQYKNAYDESESINIQNYASRLGYEGETELGNDWSAWGKYEVGVFTENNNTFTTRTETKRYMADGSLCLKGEYDEVGGEAICTLTDGDGKADEVFNNDTNTTADLAFSRRHSVIGVKNRHHNIYLGHTDHTFYNHIVGTTDLPWWNAGSARLHGAGRSGSAITYNGDFNSYFGAISFGLTSTLDATDNDAKASPEHIDSIEAAITYKVDSDTSFALGVYDDKGNTDADPLIGAALTINNALNINNINNKVSLHLQVQDVSYERLVDEMTVKSDATRVSYEFNFAVGDYNIHYETNDNDNDNSHFQSNIQALTLGYNLNIGPRTLMWFELYSEKSDDYDSDNDYTQLNAALKYDLL